MAKDIGSYAIDILRNILQSTPIGSIPKAADSVGRIASSLGALSTWEPGTPGDFGRAVGQAKMELSPFQKGVESGLKEAGKQQTIEALMAKVPPQHIEKEAGLSPQNAQQENGDGANILKQLLSVLYKPQSQMGTPGYQPPSMFGGLIKPTPSDQALLMQTYGIRPEVGLQQEVEYRKAKMGELTGENATKFGSLMEGYDAMRNIDSMLFSNPSKAQELIQAGKFTPDFFKSQESRDLQTYIEQAIQLKTRAETGAAMQPNELKNTAKRYVPRLGDSIGTMKNRLKPLAQYFERTLNVMDPQGIHRQRATANEQIVTMLQALLNEKKRRGSR